MERCARKAPFNEIKSKFQSRLGLKQGGRSAATTGGGEGAFDENMLDFNGWVDEEKQLASFALYSHRKQRSQRKTTTR